MPGDDELRTNAMHEVAEVVREYRKFLAGSTTDYAVPASRASDRLDVKHCLIDHNRRAPNTDLSSQMSLSQSYSSLPILSSAVIMTNMSK